MKRKYCTVLTVLIGLSAPGLMFADSFCDAWGAANLVTNCGFETGDFTGWTLAGNLGNYTAVEPDGFALGANSGNYFAALGATGSDNVLYEDLKTTAGVWYNFTFYLASDGLTPNDFTAKWNANSVLSQTVFTQSDIPSQPYTAESFGVLATSGDTRIEFDSRNDNGYIGLDDVSVTVPEPSSGFWGLALLGLPFLGFRRTRQGAN